jgi:Putative transposase DNA-binding domain
MPLSSQTARIVVLTGLSKFTSSLLKVGQMEAAKVWNRCREAQQSAIKERTKRAHRDMLHQRMSQWEYGKDIEYLEYKSKHAGNSSFSGSERGTSSRCPKCGHQHKPKGRNWVCKACGLSGHRDLVGSINMHPIGFQNKATFPVSKDVTYLRPGTCCWKYLNRSSRPDTGRRKGFGPLPPAFSDVCVEPSHVPSAPCIEPETCIKFLESQPPIPFGRRKA